MRTRIEAVFVAVDLHDRPAFVVEVTEVSEEHRWELIRRIRMRQFSPSAFASPLSTVSPPSVAVATLGARS